MFEEILGGLAEAGVRFVVVGGLAVVIQGYPRLTADVDLVVDLHDDNVRRAMEALVARGLRPETRNMEVFSLHDPNNPLLFVDLFAREPIPFDDLWSRADVVALGGQLVRVASIEDLIRMKRAVDRPQDRLDIEHLEEIARRRHEH